LTFLLLKSTETLIVVCIYMTIKMCHINATKAKFLFVYVIILVTFNAQLDLKLPEC